MTEKELPEALNRVQQGTTQRGTTRSGAQSETIPPTTAAPCMPSAFARNIPASGMA